MEELAAVGKNPEPDGDSIDTQIHGNSTSDSSQHDLRPTEQSSMSTASPARRPPKIPMETMASHDILSKPEDLGGTPVLQPFTKSVAFPAVAEDRPSTAASVCRWTSNASLRSLSSHFRAKMTPLHRCPCENSQKSPSFIRRVQRFEFKRWAKKLYRRAKSRFHPQVTTPAGIPSRQGRRPGIRKLKKNHSIGGRASKRIAPDSHRIPNGVIAKRAVSDSWLLRAHRSKAGK